MNRKGTSVCLGIFILAWGINARSATTMKTGNATKELDPAIYTNSAGEILKYRIYIPDGTDKNAGKYPLLLFLHGAGERGDDNRKQTVHCIKDIVTYSLEEKQPVILIVPQCPTNSNWANYSKSPKSQAKKNQPASPLKLAMDLCDETAKKLQVDKARIYIAGLSMGGFGTWDAIQRRPGYFAAAIPVCGGGDTGSAAKIKDLPIWVFHGGSDTVVNPDCSRKMVKALKDAGGKPLYTEYEGVGHNAWTKTFSNPEVLKWLFNQKKK